MIGEVRDGDGEYICVIQCRIEFQIKHEIQRGAGGGGGGGVTNGRHRCGNDIGSVGLKGHGMITRCALAGERVYGDLKAIDQRSNA